MDQNQKYDNNGKHHKQAPDSVQKAMRWVWVLSVSAITILVVALVFLLAQTSSSEEMPQYFSWLVVVNITIAGLLLLAVVWAVFRLTVRLRQGRFGSRLLAKLAAIFALVGIMPGLLVYAVSYQFVSRSIEMWFDVKVEGALSAGLKLGRESLDAQAKDLASKATTMGNLLSKGSIGVAISQMDTLRQEFGLSDVTLMSMEGVVLGSAGPSSYRLTSVRLTAEQRAQLEQESVIYGIDDSEEGALPKLWAVRMFWSSEDLFLPPRLLRVSAPVSAELFANAQSVQEAYREYQERSLGRDGLRRMYIGTLTLALFLAIFGAMVLAVMLGMQLVRPLLILAEGVRQVGAGDLSPKQLVHTRDELGGLTYAFADMTNQLREANELATESLNQVADAGAHLQTILDNLTTGVIELDDEGGVYSINPGARRILRQDVQQGIGQKLEDFLALKAFGLRAGEMFSTLPEGQGAHWQETFELEDLDGQDKITIVARGAWLNHTMKLLVIEDISSIISAQRSMAWGEVAQRLAHEIKNPLTPIQLSAERIAHKFASKLEDADRVVLHRSVKMIVDQVDAMKRLVNEFREYARLPVAELKQLDLNTLVRDIIQLYVAAPQQYKQLQLELEPDVPLIKGDAAQLRQVLHNLLQNALDAVEENAEQKIVIVTKYQGAQNSSSGAHAPGWVCLLVRDSGSGFTEKTLKRAFEPYVTTKAKGTGLGLAVVKKIMDEHGARIDLSNLTDAQGNITGAQVLLSFPALVVSAGAASTD